MNIAWQSAAKLAVHRRKVQRLLEGYSPLNNQLERPDSSFCRTTRHMRRSNSLRRSHLRFCPRHASGACLAERDERDCKLALLSDEIRKNSAEYDVDVLAHHIEAFKWLTRQPVSSGRPWGKAQRRNAHRPYDVVRLFDQRQRVIVEIQGSTKACATSVTTQSQAAFSIDNTRQPRSISAGQHHHCRSIQDRLYEIVHAVVKAAEKRAFPKKFSATLFSQSKSSPPPCSSCRM